MDKTKSEYRDIAEEYHKSKYQPWRLDIELHSLLHYLPEDDKNLEVLEMACGTGFYTNYLIKKYGKTSSFDLVPEMIEEAKRLNPNVNFFVGNAMSKQIYGEFDIVFAAYLLNYCICKEQLVDMIKTIYINLKPGGIFLTVNDNPEHDPNTFKETEKYGFHKVLVNNTTNEYTPVEYHFPTFIITNYRCIMKDLINIFNEVGFTSVEIKELIVNPDSQNDYNEFLQYKPVMILKAVKN